jgi:hypothetical protein
MEQSFIENEEEHCAVEDVTIDNKCLFLLTRHRIKGLLVF